MLETCSVLLRTQATCRVICNSSITQLYGLLEQLTCWNEVNEVVKLQVFVEQIMKYGRQMLCSVTKLVTYCMQHLGLHFTSLRLYTTCINENLSKTLLFINEDVFLHFRYQEHSTLISKHTFNPFCFEEYCKSIAWNIRKICLLNNLITQ